MSAQHKAAMAEGRKEGRAIRLYLEALQAHKPKRGRKRTADSMRARLATIDAQMASAAPLKQLQMVQERMDIEEALATSDTKVDLGELEAEFVKAAKGYSQRKGISYKAWREMGVSAVTLSAAGITRSGT